MDEKQGADDEISLKLPSLGKLKGLLDPKILLFLLLILIPIIITVGVRIQPIQLLMTDDWAQSNVYGNLKSQLSANIDAQYPSLAAADRQKMLQDQYSKALIDNKAALDMQIQQASSYYKSAFQYVENNHTYTYLGDLDSYYYLRQARNLEEKGTICDKIEDGSCIDDHMMAPAGLSFDPSLHPYAILWLYKLLHLFDNSINLMYASFYLPTIIAVLVSILTFLVAKKVAGDVGGFFAAVFVSTSQIFLTRTMGSDTDIWNLFFPVLILFLFIEMVEAKTFIRKIGWSIATGLAFGAYSFAWSAWWFGFDLVMLTYVLYLAYHMVQNLVEYKGNIREVLEKSKLKPDFAALVAIIIFAGISVSLITNFHNFAFAPFQPLVMNRIDDATNPSIWPNVYTTVAELNNSSLSEVVSMVGGKFLFFLILLGITMALLKKELKNRELTIVVIGALVALVLIQDPILSLPIIPYLAALAIPFVIAILMTFKDHTVEIKYSLLLLLWTAATLYTSMKGVRFVLLLMPIAGISLGVALGKIHSFMSALASKEIGLNRLLVGLIIFCLMAALIVAPVKAAYSTGRNFLPSISNAWADSLTNIDAKADKDAIITSWWDFGHWFKYFADRRVTFDGASQNNPQAHWVGKALLSDDEHVSMGILRMLDCGGNRAYDRLLVYSGNNSLKTLDTLNRIILMDRDNATAYLKTQGLIASQEQEILGYTHCDAPQGLLITSDDMVGKSGVWGHFGSWDFRKSYIYNNMAGKSDQEVIAMMTGIGYTPEQANQLDANLKQLQTQRDVNNWIGPWPGYITDMNPCQSDTAEMRCQMGFRVNENDQYTVVVDKAVINLTQPEGSYLLIAYISKANGATISVNRAQPSSVLIAGPDALKRYKPSGSDPVIDFDVVADPAGSTAMAADPLISDSLFTKLYFLDGRYVHHFQKFSDQSSNVVGHHIIVWDVKWND